MKLDGVRQSDEVSSAAASLPGALPEGARTLRLEPLGAEGFAPFGELLMSGLGATKAANQGTAKRCDFAAGLESTRPEARPNLAVFTSEAQSLPFALRLLERHPCSTQAFLPLRTERFLVCVAASRPDGSPDLATLRAFVGVAGQAINYRRGVWHHPIIALGAPAELAMLAWEDGGPDDCVESWFEEPIWVVE